MRLWDIYHSEIPKFLADAAQTALLVRLKGVGMNCGCEYTSFPLFKDISPYSRYDHSMGVALIVWHFTGDMAQAMSGLLHDIATPAFAHVVDFLRGDHLAQESTEQGTEECIQNSASLCGVLKTYGLSLDAVADYHRYPIADNDSPKLSADRLEYTLGNAVNFGIITREQAAKYYNDLIVGTNEHGETELIFRHPEIAHAFAKAALKCAKIYVSDPDRYAMQCLAELLKHAIERGILSEADLYLQERSVIGKIKSSPLSDQWTQFCNCSQIISRVTPGTDGIWLQVFAKKRFIDPFIVGIGRASQVFPEFYEELRTFRESKQDNWLCAIRNR